MNWSLPEPALAAAVDNPVLPRGFAAEPKWDGYRALLHRREDGVVIRSRRGTDLVPGFPDIEAAALESLPPGTALDGELVVWEDGRLAFERLQGRLNRRTATVARLAREAPAHFVAFDLLHLGDDLTGRPYTERRAALQRFFADERLGPPWTLCPSTTDPALAEGWLEWGAVGLEGLVFKRLTERYPAGRRAWRKYRARASTEAIVGAVTGSLHQPASVLLGRLDDVGRLQYAGRTVQLSRQASEQLGALLAPAPAGHPWQGWTFSAAWGSREKLDVTLVSPSQVVEVSADVALDSAGRWRHPVRLLRARADMAPGDVPQVGG